MDELMTGGSGRLDNNVSLIEESESPTEEDHTSKLDKVANLIDQMDSSDVIEFEGKKEVCIVVAGNVDSGKSSTIGVLAYGHLDDGNGSARASVAKHPHEVELGKTSDISSRTIKLNDNHEVVMVDLCGHEKYLKTTLFGITGYYPDYAILIVAANNGLTKMTREHMGILLYMNIPFVILVTRVDISPKGIYEKTVQTLDKIMKKFKRKLKMINTYDGFEKSQSANSNITQNEDMFTEVIKCAQKMKTEHHTIPCISTSNKTGYGIDLVRKLLLHLEPRKNVWGAFDNEIKNGSLFYIDDKFTPPGIGLVVSGVVKGNSIKVGDKMFIGPYQGKMIPVKIWSIHDNNKHNVDILTNRHRGCLAFRVIDKKIVFGKSEVRKGMIITSENINKNICYQFKSNIKILNHSTTISTKYSPVIHCGTVRQTAKIIFDDTQTLKMGDKAEVSFRFVDRTEFIEVGNMFFFREGTTRGVGEVVEVLAIDNDPDPNPAIPKRAKKRRKIRPNNRNRDREKLPSDIKRKIDVL